ncbi:hypothetical protein GGR32_001259 [Mesonia hippocampi]|uniref:GNAT family N-acetyltransferase n=1 Tax=Mesonia hippocampi TaxID=1628250 RepID=A0A840ELG6_9FLAO|nr:GNAT family N-acetyltransferase [Mesonia hippocampi]MBB4118968.1 hypothetical protein [Mesonia hippocampi]
MEVIQYSETYKTVWDDFVKNTKNGTFLFYRDFMEYHSDRFQDFSLMVFQDKKLIALLPANRQGDKVFSHQGLTYGGLGLSKKIKFEVVTAVLKNILVYLCENKINSFILKLMPKIYNLYPSDEIDYLLFILKANLLRRDLSASIKNSEALRIQSNRIEGVKKAKKQNLEIHKVTEFDGFWENILIPNLAETHQAKPVHTAAEIKYLQRNFPENIHQYNVLKEGVIVGGATIFETKTVAHVQYISADKNKQQLGTLDYLFWHLIENEFSHKAYFDFGTSNEQGGKVINKGLLYWKEAFGARGVVHDFYEVNPQHHLLLNTLFI